MGMKEENVVSVYRPIAYANRILTAYNDIYQKEEKNGYE